MLLSVSELEHLYAPTFVVWLFGSMPKVLCDS